LACHHLYTRLSADFRSHFPLRILFRMACMALSVACQFTDMGDNMDRVSHTKIPQGAGQLSGI